ncbi:MAG: adenosylcobinamide-phosphate synthase CbiB [Roseovarius sp.]|nr:adenosylcobinamide-phosphate synthase CbiB [Roseovarius sp.]MCY4292772.1 adenosylcobinamide-phosphate synthase CbiB [Roseovarius sp.]
MNCFLIMAAALAIDAVFGEPRWLWGKLPHPVSLMGDAIGWCDRRLNSDLYPGIAGFVAIFCLCIAASAFGWVIGQIGWVAEVIAAAALLAHKSLMLHVGNVANSLRLSTGDGRHSVSQIVGRDTTGMDGHDVARAAMESAAENFSDGVIAPIFWFAVAGPAGIATYKLVNTADSMIGYRDDRHRQFGWTAARLDDLLNYIPARLTALLIAATLGGVKKWRPIIADARMHRSPNAGYPEAALAYSLDIALSGPRSYNGAMQNFPFVNPDGLKTTGPKEIDSICGALWKCWLALFLFLLLLALFF